MEFNKGLVNKYGSTHRTIIVNILQGRYAGPDASVRYGFASVAVHVIVEGASLRILTASLSWGEPDIRTAILTVVNLFQDPS